MHVDHPFPRTRIARSILHSAASFRDRSNRLVALLRLDGIQVGVAQDTNLGRLCTTDRIDITDPFFAQRVRLCLLRIVTE